MSDKEYGTSEQDVAEEPKKGTINDPLTRSDAEAPQQTWPGSSEE